MMPRLQLRPPLEARLRVWPPRMALSERKPVAVAALQNAGTRTGQKPNEYRDMTI